MKFYIPIDQYPDLFFKKWRSASWPGAYVETCFTPETIEWLMANTPSYECGPSKKSTIIYEIEFKTEEEAMLFRFKYLNADFAVESA